MDDLRAKWGDWRRWQISPIQSPQSVRLRGEIIVALNYITLLVDDVEAVRDWYVAHLGMEIRWASPDFVLLDSPRAALGLHRGSPPRNPGNVQLHFEVPDVDAEYERLRGEGLGFREAPRTMPWGHRTAYLTDPVGHTVEIYTPCDDGGHDRS